MKMIGCLLLMALAACSKKDKSDPSFIQRAVSEASCVCTTTIDGYIWRSQMVYVIGSQPNCNSIGYYFDEDGNVLDPTINALYPSIQDFKKDAKYVKNYYTCK